MSRSVSFSMYLIAFSQNELDTIWTRANMLNKLIYPINNVAGYMVPPIIRMTIGNILTEQPGYITDINMNLADVPWDVDSEVTNVIELNITFNIIEKNYITQNNNNVFDKNNGGYLFAQDAIYDIVKSKGEAQMKQNVQNSAKLTPPPELLNPQLLSMPIVKNPLTGQYDTTAKTNQIKINPSGLVPGNVG